MNKTTELLYDGFHKIEKVNAQVNGRNVVRERLLLKSAVGGVVIDELGRIGLVIQHRPTINQTTREIPAGVLDKTGLTYKQILIEELAEECHIQPDDILSMSDKPFREYYMVAGSSDAKIALYEVRVKTQHDKMIQDDHDVERVEWVSIDRLDELVQSGQIVDAKTLIAYYHVKSMNDNSPRDL